jgi:PhnB protein
MSVKSIPDGYHTITSYLLVDGVDRLISFLVTTFDASELERRLRPDGSIMHAEVRIGDSIVMMGEPLGEFGPMPASMYVYVSDCDSVYQRALQADGISVMEPTTRPAEGDRYGGVKDTSGNIWWIATHLEEVSSEQQTNA